MTQNLNSPEQNIPIDLNEQFGNLRHLLNQKSQINEFFKYIEEIAKSVTEEEKTIINEQWIPYLNANLYRFNTQTRISQVTETDQQEPIDFDLLYNIYTLLGNNLSIFEQIRSIKISDKKSLNIFINFPEDTFKSLSILDLSKAQNCIQDLMNPDLSEAEIKIDDIINLTNSPILSKITYLNLNLIIIRAEGAIAIANSPYLSQLKYLRLQGCIIRVEGIKALANSPCLSQLEHLYLDGNTLGTEGINALAKSPYLSQLKTLHLWGNSLKNDGTTIIANSPNFSGLTDLSLCGNLIENEGAQAIVNSPFLNELTQLDLSYNEITPETQKLILEKFPFARLLF